MSFLDSILDKATDVLHKVTGMPTEDEKRNQQRMMNDQIKAYRQQTELSKQELNRVSNENQLEKRRIQEKQIRSLRNTYRPQGLLGNSPNELSNKLGG